MYRYLTLLFLSLLSFTDSFSQHKEFEFKNFTQENGLPSNESYFVYRDSRNFLWMATDQGVVRFNGNKMERFDLPDNVVFKIRGDSKGRIWFFSHTGKLAYFYKGSIHPYQYNDSIAKAFKSFIISNGYVNDDAEIIINVFPVNLRISRSGIITKYDYTSANKKDSTIFRITPLNGKQIAITVAEGVEFYNSDDIIKIEARGGYSVFYLLNEKKVTSTRNLKEIGHMLPEISFLRVHHSWIINIKYLKKYYRGKNSYIEMDDGSTVSVSIRKKGKLLDFLE